MKKDKLSKALYLIPKDYIAHFAKTEVGSAIYVTNRAGYSFFQISWYNDDKKILYLDLLSVSKAKRKQGEATKLIGIYHDICVRMKVKKSFLKANTEMWMYEWYKRLGYKDYKGEDNSGYKPYIFMHKKIKQHR